MSIDDLKKKFPEDIHYMIDKNPEWFSNNYGLIMGIIDGKQTQSIRILLDKDLYSYELLANLMKYLTGVNQGNIIEWMPLENVAAIIAACRHIGEVKVDEYKNKIIQKSPSNNKDISLALIRNMKQIPVKYHDYVTTNKIDFTDTEVCKAFIEHASEIRANYYNFKSTIIDTLNKLGADELRTWIESDSVLLDRNPCKNWLYGLTYFPYNSNAVPDEDREELTAVLSKNKDEVKRILREKVLSDFAFTIGTIGARGDFTAEEIREILAPINEWTGYKIKCLMENRIPEEIIFEKAFENKILRFILLRRTEEVEDKQETVNDITINDNKRGLFYRSLSNLKLNKPENIYFSNLTNEIISEYYNANTISYTISKDAIQTLVISSCMMGMPFNEGEIIRIINNCVYPEERETVESEFRRVLAEVREELKQINMQEPSQQDASKDTVSEEVSSVPSSDEWTQ